MKNESQSHSQRSGLWGALAGGALGFALGMLFAPQRGPDARRRLAYQLEHLVSETEDALRRLIRSSIESDARRTGDALVADAEARADHIRDDIDALLEELRKQSEEQETRSDASNTAD